MKKQSLKQIHHLAILALVSLCLFCIPTRADMLVSDNANGSVLRYDEKNGAYLGTFVAPHSGGLQVPIGLAFGPDGNFYVADAVGNTILRYNGQSGEYLGIFATNDWYYPNGIIFGPDGNLYAYVSTGVSGTGDHQIAVIDGETGATSRQFGSGLGLGGRGLAFGADGLLYVASLTAGVLVFDPTTGDFLQEFVSPINFASAGNGGAAALSFGPDGNLYVTDADYDRVLRFNGSSGSLIDQFASGGGLHNPEGLVFGPDGDLYVVSNNYLGGGTSGVIRYDGRTGAMIDQFATDHATIGEQFVLFTPPLLVGIRVSEVEIAWNSVSNATYRVDFRPSLTTNSWTPLVDCVQANGPTSRVVDKILAGAPQRYYRVVSTSCVP